MKTRQLFAAFLALSCLAGCRSREDVPFLGRWDGEFKTTKLLAKTQIPQASRNNWKGYILLYRTQDGSIGNRCQMHLENEQEGVDLKGHWRIVGRQISVAFNDVKIDDAGGADGKNPNMAYLEPNEIHQAFNAPLILNVADQKRVLQSPVVELGPLLGAYRFQKSSLPH